MIKISVAIITLNEEKKIARCLESVKDIADDIVIVDSFSTDKTEEIAKNYPVRFIKQKFLGHVEQKNLALDLTEHEYVLSLDADETLDENLIKNIKEIKKTETPADGYSFNRLTRYVNKWIYYCGWYPDTKLRLFKKSLGRWTGLNPHDIVKLSNHSKRNIIKLKGNILHYSYDSISSHVQQTNGFTTIAAKAAYKAGIRSSLFKIITRPFLKFFKDYFLKRGFLDGRYGFIICFINSLSALLKYAKLKDLQEGKDITQI